MSEIPRKRQEYFNQLMEALANKDEDELANLVRTKDPLAIRNDMSTALGQHVKQNYNDSSNIFGKNQELINLNDIIEEII